MSKKALFALFALVFSGLLCTPLQAAPRKKARLPQVVYEASFLPGKWQSSDWDMVKSWRWDYAGEWLQTPNGIVNKVPANVSHEILQNKRYGETYTAMVLKKKFKGNLLISCRMGFDYRMAPGIIVAAEPIVDAKGRKEFREHFEIILYDDGLNVWHHFFKDGKQKWIKKHYLFNKKCYAPNKYYDLSVRIKFTGRGPQLSLISGKNEIGYWEPAMFKGEYRVGIVASEGINRFENFKVTKIR